MMNIKVATVDGFQGSECDIVILSCVRTHSHGMRGKIEDDSIFFALFHIALHTDQHPQMAQGGTLLAF